MNPRALALVALVPVPLGVIAGPVLVLWQARHEPVGAMGWITPLAMASLFGGALGLLGIVPNVIGALGGQRLAPDGRWLQITLFAVVATAIALLSDIADRLLRVIGGIGLIGPYLNPGFALNIIICCGLLIAPSISGRSH